VLFKYVKNSLLPSNPASRHYRRHMGGSTLLFHDFPKDNGKRSSCFTAPGFASDVDCARNVPVKVKISKT
jgi:hypothetical protein